MAVLIIFSLCAHHKHIVMLFADDYQDSRAQKMAIVAAQTSLLFSSGELPKLLTSSANTATERLRNRSC